VGLGSNSTICSYGWQPWMRDAGVSQCSGLQPPDRTPQWNRRPGTAPAGDRGPCGDFAHEEIVATAMPAFGCRVAWFARRARPDANNDPNGRRGDLHTPEERRPEWSNRTRYPRLRRRTDSDLIVENRRFARTNSPEPQEYRQLFAACGKAGSERVPCSTLQGGVIFWTVCTRRLAESGPTGLAGRDDGNGQPHHDFVSRSPGSARSDPERADLIIRTPPLALSPLEASDHGTQHHGALWQLMGAGIGSTSAHQPSTGSGGHHRLVRGLGRDVTSR